MISCDDFSSQMEMEPGDAGHGACRVCQYQDPGTGALMYRVEKESSPPVDAADLVCMHVSARFARDFLVLLQLEIGGDLGANGCLLLVQPSEATRASDGDHSSPAPGPAEVRKTFPDPLRPTKYSQKASASTAASTRAKGAITGGKKVAAEPEPAQSDLF